MAQNAPAPLHSPGSVLFDKLLLRSGSLTVHSALQPYDRRDLFAAACAVPDTLASLPDIRYLLADNDEYFRGFAGLTRDSSGPAESDHTFLKVFYTRPAHFLSIDEPDFFLRVNPIFQFNLAPESQSDDLLFVNRRGIDLRGGVDQSVFFNTQIIEAQLRPSSYIRRFVSEYKALPDAGLHKDFDSRLFPGPGAYDYLTSSGSVGVRVLKHISVQLGHGKHFIGDGYRSLFLSDFAKNYFYLKFNTRIWRFHYQNLFAELGAREKLPGNTLVPKKYIASHYLSLKVSRSLTLGFFESVVFAREQNNFELQYLNPVIFYRSIEHHVGSPDNILIGFSASWDAARYIRFYSQFLLDEFKFDEFFSSRQWWGNKYGLQLGAFYPDAFGIRDLDMRIEYNRVRPFTYSHYDSLGSYAHFNQPLAHPAGANFSELLFKLDYRPLSRLYLTGALFVIRGADDTDETSYGSNILRSNVLRNADYGIGQRQGAEDERFIVSLNVAYMWRHNLFLEAQYFRRDFTSQASATNLLSQYLSLGVRWNYFSGQEIF